MLGKPFYIYAARNPMPDFGELGRAVASETRAAEAAARSVACVTGSDGVNVSRRGRFSSSR